MQCLHLGFKLLLGSSNGLVLASQLRQLFISVRQLLFSDSSSTIRLFKKGAGFLKSSLKLRNISFQLLLHAKAFSFAPALSLKSCLHAINSLTKVFASSGKLLFLFSNSSLNLLSDLSEF